MKKRVKMNKRKFVKSFRKNAARTHIKNLNTRPMRGGIRL